MKKTMIFLMLVLSVWLFTIPLNAQNSNAKVFGKVMTKYRNLETAGTVLTVTGAAAFFAGNIMYWKMYNGGEGDPSKDKVRGYRNLMIGGLGLMTIGIPLWAVGKSKMKHLTIQAGLVKYRDVACSKGFSINIRF